MSGRVLSRVLLRRLPALCTLGELQYCAPPEERHTAEAIWREVREDGIWLVREFWKCDGTPLPERRHEERELPGPVSGR